MRGTREIGVAMLEAQLAATRNKHKPHWRKVPLYRLMLKLLEETLELIGAVFSGDRRRSQEELGDLLWVLIMLADRLGILETPARRMEVRG